MENSKASGDFRLHADFVQVPRFVFDVLLQAPGLPNTYLRVLLFLFRKTLGWGKSEDYVSLSQISRGAWVGRRDIVAALKFWESLGIIRFLPIGKRHMNRVELKNINPDSEALTSAICDWVDLQAVARREKKKVRLVT